MSDYARNLDNYNDTWDEDPNDRESYGATFDEEEFEYPDEDELPF
jgi:hypothetical protein